MKDVTFFADESLDNRIVIHLRKLNYTIVSIFDLNRGISDDKILLEANKLKAIVLTEDKDFGELTYRLQKQSFGIVLLRLNGLTINQKIKIVEELFNNHFDKLKDSFTVINHNKVRINSFH